MMLEPVLQSQSARERLRGYWSAVSQTLAGDIIATALAVAFMVLLFVGCMFGIIALVGGVHWLSGLIRTG